MPRQTDRHHISRISLAKADNRLYITVFPDRRETRETTWIIELKIEET